jgi:acyl carrier protein
MSEQEKIEMLEDIMDLDPGTLKIDDVLADYEEWDSLTALTYISEMDSKFGKKVSGQEVKSFVTVADAIALMK